jgi:hypothetical protein
MGIFNDDDNKFSCDLIENVFERAEQYGASHYNCVSARA